MEAMFARNTRTSIASSASSSAPAVFARSDNRRGIYLGATSVGNQAGFVEYLDALEAAGGNAFVLDVKGSNIYFHSDAPLATELTLVRPKYDLPEVIRMAHERGMYVIGRFIALKDPLFSSLRPDAQIRHPKTNVSVGSVWVDAGTPVVIEYNREILETLLRAGIDEVNFDYIRYPTEYAMSQIGLTGAEKADRIERFITMARNAIDQIHPTTKLGLSTYAILGWNYPVNMEPLGQDFVRYAPMLDVISPMAYPSTFAEGAYYNPAKHKGSRAYYLVWQTLEGYKKLLGPEHSEKLRPWIQGYYVTPKEARDQIDAVYATGLCGFTFWNARNVYTPVFAAMKNLPEPPEKCRDGAVSGVPEPAPGV